MSRVPPIGLRISSGTQNTPFIGTSKYYYYNQLKQNLTFKKGLMMLGKQLAFPTTLHNPKANRVTKSSPRILWGGLEIFQSGLLPISTLIKAKQYFNLQIFQSKYLFKKKVICFGCEQLKIKYQFNNTLT